LKNVYASLQEKYHIHASNIYTVHDREIQSLMTKVGKISHLLK